MTTISEIALGVVVKVVGERLCTAALNRVAGLPRILGKADRPNLDKIVKICGYFDKFLPPSKLDEPPGPEVYRFAQETAESPFKRMDRTLSDVMEIWFRTDTEFWAKKRPKVIGKWTNLVQGEPEPYFSGRHAIDFNFEDPSIKSTGPRHPVIRTLHPFIMISRINHDNFKSEFKSKDPSKELSDLFVKTWEMFSDDKFITFDRGLVLQLEHQAYAEGGFTIKNSPFIFNGSEDDKNITIERFLIVSVSVKSIYVMNVGIPYWSGGGKKYLEAYDNWMNEFRIIKSV